MNKEIALEHLQSAFKAFITGFIVAGGASLTITGNIDWTLAFWTPILVTAVNAGVKEVLARFAPKILGGRVGPTMLGRRYS